MLKNTELTAAEPWLPFLRSRPCSAGRQHNAASPSPCSECSVGRRKVHQLEPFRCAFRCPQIHHLFVLFFLRLKHPKIFNGIVNPKCSKKLSNTPSASHWSTTGSYPQCPLSKRILLSLTPKQREVESSLTGSKTSVWQAGHSRQSLVSCPGHPLGEKTTVPLASSFAPTAANPQQVKKTFLSSLPPL